MSCRWENTAWHCLFAKGVTRTASSSRAGVMRLVYRSGASSSACCVIKNCTGLGELGGEGGFDGGGMNGGLGSWCGDAGSAKRESKTSCISGDSVGAEGGA
eukprot:6176550-Pleurochrysis_carterae.AAC.2